MSRKTEDDAFRACDAGGWSGEVDDVGMWRGDEDEGMAEEKVDVGDRGVHPP